MLAKLGYRTMDEMVGQTHRLQIDESLFHYKSQGLDLRPLLIFFNVHCSHNERQRKVNFKELNNDYI